MKIMSIAEMVFTREEKVSQGHLFQINVTCPGHGLNQMLRDEMLAINRCVTAC
jgi:hypothetical protein